MAFTYPYPILSNPIVKGEIESNFTALANRLGSLTGGDLTTTANIYEGQLAKGYQEVWLKMRYASAWPAPGGLIDVQPIPGSNGDDPWIVTDVAWTCSNIGDGNGTFNLRYGSYNALGVWVTAGTILANSPLTLSVVNLGNQGRPLENGTVPIAFGASPVSLYLESQVQGVGVLATGVLRMHIVLKRFLTVLP